MPVCTKCKEEKKEDAFRKSSRSKSGFESKCKDCRIQPKLTQADTEFLNKFLGKRGPFSRFCYRCLKPFSAYWEEGDCITCGDCAYGLELHSCECCQKQRQYYEFPLAPTCHKCVAEKNGIIPQFDDPINPLPQE